MDKEVTLPVMEQDANKAVMLRHFVANVDPIFEALSKAESRLLITIRDVRIMHPEESSRLTSSSTAPLATFSP